MSSTPICATALLLMIVSARAQDTIPTTEPNCNLTSPPAASGLVPVMHTGFFNVFPRKSDMARDYNGCQTVWQVEINNDKYERLALAYFNRGSLALIRYERADVTCRYQNEILITKSAICLDLKNANFPVPSLPAACLEEFKAGKVANACEQMD